jgi:hypothetical protein
VAMWIDDLGRLTPFGRTFDVYIQTGFDPEFSYPNGDPRRPYMIGCTRGNESPSRSFGWAIEGEMFKNRRPDHLYPWLDNCQECIDYWTIDTGICCSSPSQNDYGDLIKWNADVDWESEKHPGSFHIARFTGPDYFSSGGVVRFACGNDHPCDPAPYSVNYYPDNSCPSDLNEDGIVGFQDLLQVLADVAAYKYHPQTNNGFNAILKVLSEWGDC